MRDKKLPVDEDSCKEVYIEYKTIMLMPWGSYITIPQAFIITCVMIICLWLVAR